MARILVVDGDEHTRHLYEAELERDGHVVVAVPDASAVRAAIRRHVPDLAILEVGPPDAGGLGVVGEVLSLGRTIRIVLQTASMLYEDDFRSWLADAYIRKSADITELRSAVRDVLAKCQPATAA